MYGKFRKLTEQQHCTSDCRRIVQTHAFIRHMLRGTLRKRFGLESIGDTRKCRTHAFMHMLRRQMRVATGVNACGVPCAM